MQLRKQHRAIYKGADDKFEWKWVREALSDPFVYIASLAFFTSSVAIFGYGTFLPTLIRGFGYNQFEANYLTIPVYTVGAISLVTQAYWSDRLQQRAMFLFISACPVITAYLICVGTPSRVAGYVAMFILVSGVYSFSLSDDDLGRYQLGTGLQAALWAYRSSQHWKLQWSRGWTALPKDTVAAVRDG